MLNLGYRITYGENAEKKELAGKKRKLPLRWIGAGLLVIAMLIPSVRNGARDALLPGNSEVTAAAVEALVEDLRSGDSVSEAVSAFCAYIIHDGA